MSRARSQVIDMRSLKANHIGDQPMRVMQAGIGFGIDDRLAAPTEGFDGLGNEFPRFLGDQPALGLGLGDQFHGPIRNDSTAREDIGGLVGQSPVLQKIQPQKRGEDPERIPLQRIRVDGAKSGGMHGNSRDGKIVVADRTHPHDREHAADA